jgi:hypothetical protein
MSDLSLATLDDIVAELRTRKLDFALVVNHITGGGYIPGGDVQSEERHRVYQGKTFGPQHPALVACDLIDGVQLCLNKCPDLDDVTVIEASRHLNLLKEAIFLKWEERYDSQ